MPKFVCAKEASALLNCIAANEYAEHKCLERMKQLRRCTQKERVVSFNLLSDAEQVVPNAAEDVASTQQAPADGSAKPA